MWKLCFTADHCENYETSENTWNQYSETCCSPESQHQSPKSIYSEKNVIRACLPRLIFDSGFKRKLLGHYKLSPETKHHGEITDNLTNWNWFF